VGVSGRDPTCLLWGSPPVSFHCGLIPVPFAWLGGGVGIHCRVCRVVLGLAGWESTVLGCLGCFGLVFFSGHGGL